MVESVEDAMTLFIDYKHCYHSWNLPSAKPSPGRFQQSKTEKTQSWKSLDVATLIIDQVDRLDSPDCQTCQSSKLLEIPAQMAQVNDFCRVNSFELHADSEVQIFFLHPPKIKISALVQMIFFQGFSDSKS